MPIKTLINAINSNSTYDICARVCVCIIRNACVRVCVCVCAFVCGMKVIPKNNFTQKNNFWVLRGRIKMVMNAIWLVILVPDEKKFLLKNNFSKVLQRSVKVIPKNNFTQKNNFWVLRGRIKMFLDTIWLVIDQKNFCSKNKFYPRLLASPCRPRKKFLLKKIIFSPSSCFSLMDADEPRKKFLFKK